MLRLLSLIAALLIAACSFDTGGPGIDTDSAPDGDGNSAIDGSTIDSACGFSAVHFNPCDLPAPSGVITLGMGEWILDTNNGSLTGPNPMTIPSALIGQSQGPMIRVMSVGGFCHSCG